MSIRRFAASPCLSSNSMRVTPAGSFFFKKIPSFSNKSFFQKHPQPLLTFKKGLQPTPGPLPLQGGLQLTMGGDRPSSSFGMALKLSPLRGSPFLSFGWRDVWLKCRICAIVVYHRICAIVVYHRICATAERETSRTSDGPSLP